MKSAHEEHNCKYVKTGIFGKAKGNCYQRNEGRKKKNERKKERKKEKKQKEKIKDRYNEQLVKRLRSIVASPVKNTSAFHLSVKREDFRTDAQSETAARKINAQRGA
jgi:ribosomal protein L9